MIRTPTHCPICGSTHWERRFCALARQERRALLLAILAVPLFLWLCAMAAVPGHPLMVSALAAALSLAVSLVYLKRLWDAFLTRRASDRPRLPESFTAGGLSDQGLYRSVEFSHSAQRLRRHVEHRSSVLDLTATVERTIRAGNWFTPIYRQVKRTPEYLVLIDRASLRDHQCHLATNLVRYLQQDELVAIDHYYFDRDPRYCTREQHPLHGLTLAELNERHPHHCLLIFTDGSGFFDPYNGQPQAWLNGLHHWGTPAIFTLSASGHWDAREELLIAQGFELYSADGPGLAAFADRSDRIAQREPTGGATGGTAVARLPARLSRLPQRWVGRTAPDPDEQDALLAELERYLGADGFLWLAACAVYPELHWPLTLELGKRLGIREPTSLLARLAPLPWLRHGRMPDWVHELLLDALGGRELRVRREVETLIGPGPGSGLALEHVVPGEEQHPAQLFTGAAIRDYVFPDFMGGRLSVRVSGLRRRLAKVWRRGLLRVREMLRDWQMRLRRRWLKPLAAWLPQFLKRCADIPVDLYEAVIFRDWGRSGNSSVPLDDHEGHGEGAISGPAPREFRDRFSDFPRS
jgi:hypothetical protein